MSERHVIGGTTYVPVGISTIEHDVWLMGKLRKTKLDEVVLGNGEAPELLGRRFIMEVMASGEALSILGGILIPESIGPDGWTPAVAEETGAALGRLKSTEDKEIIFGIMFSTLLAFFEAGPSWLLNSRTVS